MDKYNIDGHKLSYHVERTSKWLAGVDIAPIYVEISPAGGCNHRCTYCALDFMGYKARFLDSHLLKERITEMAGLGVKSVMYAGEGEPLLHKDIAAITNHTAEAGIDVAFTTNGVLFDEKLARECLHSITWIKVSINAATPETYAKVHRTDAGDFDKAIINIAHAVKVKHEQKLTTAIGMQMVLLPENADEAVMLAEKAKAIGADYLVIKPYSHHKMSLGEDYHGLTYSEYFHIEEELNKLSSPGFEVIFRLKTMRKLESEERGYERCMALPFWSYIDSGGTLWACSAYLGDERFKLGNVMEEGFEAVWKGEKRRELMKYAQSELDVSECRVNCRMDEVNRYLWNLKNPPEHVNFI